MSRLLPQNHAWSRARRDVTIRACHWLMGRILLLTNLHDCLINIIINWTFITFCGKMFFTQRAPGLLNLHIVGLYSFKVRIFRRFTPYIVGFYEILIIYCLVEMYCFIDFWIGRLAEILRPVQTLRLRLWLLWVGENSYCAIPYNDNWVFLKCFHWIREFSDYQYLSLKGFKPATCCVRDLCATTAPTRHNLWFSDLLDSLNSLNSLNFHFIQENSAKPHADHYLW